MKLTAPAPNLIHEFHNFGEDVYRLLRDECDVSLDEIDTSISEFHLRQIHRREVRSITAKVRKIAEKYKGLPQIDIVEVQKGGET